MKTLYMFKGLPGSGKSTAAREMQEGDGNIVRVNKDDLRAMLHNGVHSRGREAQVLRIRDAIIEDSLEQGKHVIVDDTNYNPIHEERLRQIAQKHGAEFKVTNFSVDTEEHIQFCIANDLKRPNSVGEQVIRSMYNKYVKIKKPAKQLKPMIFDEKLPYCIIFDLDGTLACMGDRSPYDGKSCSVDKPNVSVVDLANIIHDYGDREGIRDLHVIIFSGRNGESKPETIEWLKEHAVQYNELHMRAEGDFRKDSIIKREMFDTHVRDKYNVLFVVDDRDQVVEMWREMGLTCLQVAPGDF